MDLFEKCIKLEDFGIEVILEPIDVKRKICSYKCGKCDNCAQHYKKWLFRQSSEFDEEIMDENDLKETYDDYLYRLYENNNVENPFIEIDCLNINNCLNTNLPCDCKVVTATVYLCNNCCSKIKNVQTFDELESRKCDYCIISVCRHVKGFVKYVGDGLECQCIYCEFRTSLSKNIVLEELKKKKNMKQKIVKLKQEILELKYQPGGKGAKEAQKHFESLQGEIFVPP